MNIEDKPPLGVAAKKRANRASQHQDDAEAKKRHTSKSGARSATFRIVRGRQILDVVHGYVAVPRGLDNVLDSAPVQRLRGVSQTALASMVYPSANGTRFEHSIGAMHLARTAFINAWFNSEPAVQTAIRIQIDTQHKGLLDQDPNRVAEVLGQTVAAVGLLHDVGHPPYSHALEDYFRRHAEVIFEDTPTFTRALKERQAVPFHELAGEWIVDNLADSFSKRVEFDAFRSVYLSDPDKYGWASAMHAIVASVVDVDRLDYVVRDSLHAGTEYGAVDVERLISALEFRLTENQEVRLALGLRARSAAELLLVQRLQATRWMYKHPRVVAAEALLRRSLDALEFISSTAQPDHFQVDERPDEWATGAIARLKPTLNYIRASSEYRISGLALRNSSESGAQDISSLQLEIPLEKASANQPQSHAAHAIFTEIQIGVNDSAIQKYCSNSAIVCRLAIDKGAREQALNRYLHLYDASLRRSSQLVVLWKRFEEYTSIAEEVYQTDIVQRLVENLREKAYELEDQASNAGASFEKNSMLRFLEDPLVFLNYLGYALLHQRTDQLSEMLTQTSPQVRGRTGLWVCTFAGRRNPLQSMSPQVLLEGRQGSEAVSLHESSPLVASIDELERRSMMLFAFFLVTDPGAGFEAKPEIRTQLRRTFVEVFPIFLKDHAEQVTIGAKESLFKFNLLKRARAEGN